MADEVAVRARALRKSYGETAVLAGLDLEVAWGTIHALLGRNGAGKTTTVRILATLLEADGGQARVAGFDVRAQRTAVRRAISVTGQQAAVDEQQTGEENLRMIARLRGASRREAAAGAGRLLRRFELTHAGRRRVGSYSGGMRRKLDLAMGLVGEPTVVFLDEPTTGLDLPSRQALWDAVAQLAGSGVAVLLTTQYLEEADRLADAIAVIDGGRVVAAGTAAQLKAKLGEQRLELTFAAEQPFDDVARALGERLADTQRPTLTLQARTDGSAAHVRALLDELDPTRTHITHFAVHGATLEDVFLAVTGDV
jgi:ABC-2 type transport system ATP-binding protein